MVARSSVSRRWSILPTRPRRYAAGYRSRPAGRGRSWHHMVFCVRCGARPALPLPRGAALCRLCGGRLPAAAERRSQGASSSAGNITLRCPRRAGHGPAAADPSSRLVFGEREVAEVVREWSGTSSGSRRGSSKGLECGIEQGRVEERALLCRLAARRFDADAGQQAGRRAGGGGRSGPSGAVREWIIECGTAAELFVRLADTPRRSQ